MSEVNSDAWLSAVLSRDAMTFEDAYWGERPPAEEMIPKIIDKLGSVSDPYTRGKLIELLGECGDQSVLPLLEAELQNQDQSVQEWASSSITALKQGEPWQKNPKYF